MRTLAARIIALSVLVLSAPAAQAQTRTKVDVELMLAVDVSYSMSSNEREIQRRGYATALRDPEIAKAITSGYYKKVAIAYVEWSGSFEQRVIVPWTLIETPDDLSALATRLSSEYLPILRRTSISGVLDFAPASFESNAFDGRRRVIDVSGDGPNNMGRPVTAARDDLVAQGFAINGLPLMTEEGYGAFFHLEDLDQYYAHCVIGGPFAFSIPVRSWEEFPDAVRRKLVLELAGGEPESDTDLPVVRASWRGATDGGYDCMIGEKIWREFIRRDPGGDVLP